MNAPENSVKMQCNVVPVYYSLLHFFDRINFENNAIQTIFLKENFQLKF